MPEKLERKLKAQARKKGFGKERTGALAYCAGIIDGEGCIGIYVRNPRGGRGIRHELKVQVNMQTTPAIEMLKECFGGLQDYRVKNKKTNAFCYQWRIGDRRAYGCLKILLPYLRVKKMEAEKAIEFYEKCILPPKLGYGVARKLGQSELDLRQSYRLSLSQLKKNQYIYA